MKKIIISKCMNYIKNKTNYNDTKLAEIKYGLEGIYLTISKMIIIFSIACFLGIIKEVIIYMFIYNILRIPSFGLHATKSWICLLSSSILFIGIPLISMNIKISLFIKTIVSIFGIIFMFKNSPADTYKRPIVSKKRRIIYRFISTILTIIYSFLILFIKNSFIVNCLFFSIIMQNCMISPTVYKIFKLPYNNHIEYLKRHPDLTFN